MINSTEKQQVTVETRDGITTFVQPSGLRHGTEEQVHMGVLLYSNLFRDKHGRVVRFIQPGKPYNRHALRVQTSEFRRKARGLARREKISFTEACERVAKESGMQAKGAS